MQMSTSLTRRGTWMSWAMFPGAAACSLMLPSLAPGYQLTSLRGQCRENTHSPQLVRAAIKAFLLDVKKM